MDKYTGIDLFSGVGGMSLGAEWAGIQVCLAVEKDKNAASTFRTNHKGVKLLETDIRDFDPSQHVTERPFVVFGGPPCQGFSTSNTKSRNMENQNNFLFEEFIKVIRILEPKWFVFENVEGFESFELGVAVSILKENFEKLNYSVEFNTLLASNYGVPQNRSRFFMVGNRIGKKFTFPKPNGKNITVWEAIKDLPSLQNGDKFEELDYKKNIKLNPFLKIVRKKTKKATQNYVSLNKNYVIERYRFIKPGQNWKAIPENLMENYKNRLNCHSGIYKRLDPNKPSVVISNYRKNMLIHPFEDRGLSVREAARLQSFPDEFRFQGTLMHMQQQIGNAVPPLLSKAIFDQIIKINKEEWNG